MSKLFNVDDVISMLDEVDREETDFNIDQICIQNDSAQLSESNECFVSFQDSQMNDSITHISTQEKFDKSVSEQDKPIDKDVSDYVLIEVFEANSEEEGNIDDGRVEFTVQFENDEIKLIENSNETLVVDGNQLENSVVKDVDNGEKELSSATDENNNDLSSAADENNNDLSFSLTENSEESEEETSSVDNEVVTDYKVRSRKRRKNYGDWKQSVRKRRRQSGESYTSIRGKQVRSRELKYKKDCSGKCKFRCTESFSIQERSDIFKEFWSLSDNEKFSFYLKTTERHTKERARTTAENSRRQFSFRYFLVSKGAAKIRVCKEFYLSTIDISAKRISLCHEKAQSNDHAYRRGNHTKKCTSEEATQFVKEHILSFPRVPAHYCRASTSKEYLEPDLSVKKMYEMYCEKCQTEDTEPVKKNMYYKIFNTNFNLSFHIPKKDVCDLCAETEMRQSNSEESNSEKVKNHLRDKTETNEERQRDRHDASRMVVCFDLENVLQCPRSNVGNFFYKRKLNVYNLTAHCSKNRKAYNALWGENVAGRGANEIASALYTILDSIITDYPETTELILWSDSCIPQNRNSIMTLALKTFVQNHPNLNSVTQKYCTPGHSSIQEVDNVHSHIEKGLKICNVYSPLTLVRVMTRIRPKFSKVIQLTAKTFLNFKRASTRLHFTDIPYSKVKCIMISHDMPFHVNHKTSFADDSFTEVCIRPTTTRSGGIQDRYLPSVKQISKQPTILKEKKIDIISMLCYMPKEDQDYFIVSCDLKPLMSKKKRNVKQ